MLTCFRFGVLEVVLVGPVVIQPGEMLPASVTAGYEPALLGATFAALLVPAMLVEPELTQPWKMLSSTVMVAGCNARCSAGAGDVS